MSKIFAVDFDGTLCLGEWPKLGAPNIPLIKTLINKQRCGDKLILWTCRTGEALENAVGGAGKTAFFLMQSTIICQKRLNFTAAIRER